MLAIAYFFSHVLQHASDCNDNETALSAGTLQHVMQHVMQQHGLLVHCAM